MILVNEKVEHISYGVGVVTEEKDNKIWVKFKDEAETKAFLYPDAFEKFLKAVNAELENNVKEELRKKKEELEFIRLEKERKEAELSTSLINATKSRKRSGTRTLKKNA
jgi:hypothetical protein